MSKRKSRAMRLSEVISTYQDTISKLEEIREDVDASNGTLKDLKNQANEAISTLDTSEVECLAEEMRSWADNMEEHFSATDKYQRVEEAANQLEGVDLELGEISDVEDKDGLSSEIQDRIDSLESAISDLESVEFPGMFG